MTGRPTGKDPYAESPVPGALGRLLGLLAERVGLDAMDRLWIFPPLVKGRKEWGLVAVSCKSQDPSRRTLVTARYAAELTGNGIRFEPSFMSEGEAPPDRLPAVMDGVVRRSELPLGTPRVVEVQGDAARFQALLVEGGGGGVVPDGHRGIQGGDGVIQGGEGMVQGGHGMGEESPPPQAGEGEIREIEG